MGSPYQSDSMRHARDVCEGICFHIIANMGFWFLVITGQAMLMSPKGQDTSRDGFVNLREGAFIVCNTNTL